MIKRITATELAAELGYDLAGDGGIEVTGIAYAGNAREDELAVAYNDRDIKTTNAAVVLSEPSLLITDKTLLFFYEDVASAIIKTAELMIKKGLYPDYAKLPMYRQCSGGFMCGANVIIGEDAEIAPYTCIGDDVRIGRGVKIAEGVSIGSGTVIGDNVKIMSGAQIGASAFYHTYDGKYISFVGVGRVIIGSGTEIGYNTIIQRGTVSDTVIGENCIIGNLVDIGHDCKMGRDCRVISLVGIAGNVTIGNFVKIYGKAGIAGNVSVGDGAVIKAQSAVTKNVKCGEVILGTYGRPMREEIKRRAALNKLLKKGLN